MLKIELYYDKECPFCNSYTNFLKLKDNCDLALFNARDAKSQIYTLKKQGFDINNGFIIKVDKKDIYQGSNAILFLNQLAEKKLFFYDNWFFKSLIYPFIKLLRKIILRIKKQDINI